MGHPVDYIWDVTLANRFSDSIVQFSLGITDCGKMNGCGSARHNLFRPTLPLLI